MLYTFTPKTADTPEINIFHSGYARFDDEWKYRTRGKLYDKINVSLRTMDIIVYSVAALLVIALIVGIAMGN